MVIEMDDGREQIDPRVRDVLRDLHDAEYEASTPGAARWRERTDDEFNLARRHRFGRARDMDRPPLVRVWQAWVLGAAMIVWLALIAWVLAR